MRAILIKTDEKSIEEVKFNGTLEHLYQLLDISTTERVSPEEGRVDLWLDEEGWLKNENAAFFFAGFDQPLAGRGLLTGEIQGDEGGEFGPLPDDWTLESAQDKVTWIA